MLSIASFSLVLALIITAPTYSQDAKWSIVDSAQDMAFAAFECIDSQYCCGITTGGPTAGYVSIVCTSDGGESWETVWADSARPGISPPSLRLWDLEITPGYNALATVDSGMLLRVSIDRGTVDRIRIDTGAGRLPTFVSMIDDRKGYVITHGREADLIYPILHFTEDGWETWTTKKVPVPDEWEGTVINTLQVLQKSGSLLVYFVRNPDNTHWDRLVMVSHDTGNTFDAVPIDNLLIPDTSRFVLSSAAPVGYNHVYLGGTMPRYPGLIGVLLTLDTKTMDIEGRFADNITDFPVTVFSNIHFRDSLNGVAGGWANIYRTVDAGQSWTVDSVEHFPGEFEYAAYSFSDNSGMAANFTAGYLMRYGTVSSVDVPGSHPNENEKQIWTVVNTTGSERVSLPYNASSSDQLRITVSSLTGEQIFDGEERSTGGWVVLPVRLESGVYFVRIEGGGDSTIFGRIVVRP